MYGDKFGQCIWHIHRQWRIRHWFQYRPFSSYRVIFRTYQNYWYDRIVPISPKCVLISIASMVRGYDDNHIHSVIDDQWFVSIYWRVTGLNLYRVWHHTNRVHKWHSNNFPWRLDLCHTIPFEYEQLNLHWWPYHWTIDGIYVNKWYSFSVSSHCRGIIIWWHLSLRRGPYRE